jgi:Holliday junction resolvase RusA-like endonuclease
VKLVIEGAPRTKKNSLRRIRRGRKTFTVPSAAHEAWEAIAIPQLRYQWGRVCTEADWLRGRVTYGGPWTGDLNMRAIVYRDRAVGDLLNYLASVSDALERAGVVEDDKLIVSVDGSRLAIDRARPRVEIELTPAGGSNV